MLLGENVNHCIENASFDAMKRQETQATSAVNCQLITDRSA
jgi:hypothetical protein